MRLRRPLTVFVVTVVTAAPAFAQAPQGVDSVPRVDPASLCRLLHPRAGEERKSGMDNEVFDLHDVPTCMVVLAEDEDELTGIAIASFEHDRPRACETVKTLRADVASDGAEALSLGDRGFQVTNLAGPDALLPISTYILAFCRVPYLVVGTAMKGTTSVGELASEREILLERAARVDRTVSTAASQKAEVDLLAELLGDANWVLEGTAFERVFGSEEAANRMFREGVAESGAVFDRELERLGRSAEEMGFRTPDEMIESWQDARARFQIVAGLAALTTADGRPAFPGIQANLRIFGRLAAMGIGDPSARTAFHRYYAMVMRMDAAALAERTGVEPPADSR